MDGSTLMKRRSSPQYEPDIDAPSTIKTQFNYSKRELSCILPSIASDQILLPASAITWLISQPESAVSATLPHEDFLQTEYTFLHPWIVAHPLHHEVIKSELTRQLGALTADIIDELSTAFNELWGTDTVEWKEVCVFETSMRIIARTSNRIFVGLPWCRNQALLDHGMGFAQSLPMASAVLRLVPKLLRPAAAVLLTIPNKKHAKRFTRILRPEIERRLQLTSDIRKNVSDLEPNDFLQWSINRARNHPNPAESDPDIIAERVLTVNFAAIHTSTFSITNAVFDLLAVENSQNYLEQLRDEAESVLACDKGAWTKAGLAIMYKIDSTLRESTRLGSFLGVGLVRKVIALEGVTSPNGTFCPQGSSICVPTNGVLNDSMEFTDSGTYQPFRFSEQRLPGAEADQAAANGPKTNKADDYIKKANLSFVSTSPSYHPFGHGRHACPGRFFAANELKLMLAYMVLNYEFQMLPERPASQWIGTSLVPPLRATIRIRRRKQDSEL